MGLLNLLNGWKSIIGYVLLSAPSLTDTHMLVGAFKELVANPNQQTVMNFVGQAVLAVGIIHKALKNVKVGQA